MTSKIRQADILSSLRAFQPVSGEILARRLKVSRQALHKQIRILRVRGYSITGKPKSGYVLDSQSDVIVPEELEKSLAAQKIGRKIRHYAELRSTQDTAKEMAQAGEPEGSVIVAEKQTGGRGRMGREWISDRGGLWVSVLLRPSLLPQNVPALSLAASMAISDAIRSECGIECGLKWPNDLWANVGSLQNPIFKKVCGVLTEMSAEADRVNWVVLGFGINVNNFLPSQLRASAANLKGLSGQTVGRQKLLEAILKSLETAYGNYRQKGFVDFRASYSERCVLRNHPVTLNDFGKTVHGEFVDVDAQGALVLRLADGSVQNFFAGDVTLGSIAFAGSK